MSLMYIPSVVCEKCGKPAKVSRIFDPKSKRRYCEAKCHGQTAQIDFVGEPGMTVALWGKPPSDQKPD